MGKGPVIYLEGYNIDEISYINVSSKETLVSKEKPEFSFEVGFTENLEHAIVKMTVELNQGNRKIMVKMSGNFSIPDLGYTKEEIKLFVAQNGSAILYPYLRSVVSIISTLDGPSAVVLPTLNMIDELAKLSEKNKKDLSES
ncbi:protein-export chaperone SecB [Enterococcus faecium]|uniref:protein-export chaperone SecB n=1 Tax=Enterococcus faecium TaxID=1352 RepID=UPI0024B98690|nr:protein-export chaperone SecB [Enterococcus faecium]